MASSETDICNQSQLHLGEKPNIESIETPETDAETIYKVQYDVARRALLRETKPQFAIKRLQVAQTMETPLFGFSKVYKVPSDSLKFLGIGNIEDKESRYTLEGNKIYTDEGTSNDDGVSFFLNIRYLKNAVITSDFDPNFEKVFSLQLAKDVCESITGSINRTEYLQSQITLAKGTMKAMTAQENPPIRKSESKFLSSKFTDVPTFTEKK